MRAVETTPAASQNAGADEELSSALVWPVSHHGPGTRALEDQSGYP